MQVNTDNSNITKIAVSVILPLYNEEKFIANCIHSLLCQDYDMLIMEWLFVDGNSTDKTVEIIEGFRRKYPDLIKLMNNPHKTVPYAMNIGIRAASGKYIIRLDVHCTYPADYISKCVNYLDTMEIDNVGGCAVTRSNGFVGNAIARLLSSEFGVGNSRFRTGKTGGYVDTVPFGAFRREVFDKVGLYDERLTRNQDNELNYRIRKNGGKIFLAEDITFIYYCRNSLKALCEMAMNNGKWNIITMKLTPGAMSLRHYIPLLFVLSLIALPVLSFFSPVFMWLLLAELAVYSILNVVFSFKAAPHIKYVPMLFILFPFFHISYGTGSLLSIVKRCSSVE